MKQKIPLLIAGCILLVLTLTGIQAYLVRNTYELTRSQYETEIKTALVRMAGTPVAAGFEDRINDSLKSMAGRYAAGQISKKTFFSAFGQKIASVRTAADRYFTTVIRDSLHLDGVRYQAGFRELIIEYNGKRDTLLSSADRVWFFTGQRTDTAGLLALNHEASRVGDYEKTKLTGQARKQTSLYVQSLIVRNADNAGWQRQVLRRMAGVLLLAAAIIVAAILLFYMVFRAMFRQKRLADIRTDLANNLTHELRTPLSAAGLALKSLQRREAKQDPRLSEELIATLQRQFEKLQGITDSVLDDAMGMAVRPSLKPTVIAAWLKNYARDAGNGRPGFRSEIDGSGYMLRTDTRLLEKAMDNLLDNAFKYGRPGGEVELKGYPERGAYYIRVQDNGPGISKPYQQLVFDRFYRVPEQDQHNVKGLGLGLHAARQAIAAIGGSLSLQSEPGQGCTFTIQLPKHEH
ncbi:HAMP domain-containing sensor histidine kinase [Mucilaginibacter sp. CAU 1740]|uniref:sensor histidine kinase n=1 Tax=Mucilaginibacter sp. CAU 1740 TaxID=3140365 RepID=UPI00325B0E37